MKLRSMTVWVCVALAGPAMAQVAPGGGPGVVVETPAQAERAQVERLLRGYHGLPERSLFEAAAADPAAVLRAVAADEAIFTPMRKAAVEALKWWPDEATWALYGRLAAPGGDVGLRHRVLRDVVVFGERALPVLSAALGDADPQVRVTAAYALFDLPGEAGGAVLREAVKGEADPQVRGQIERLLAQGATLR